MRPSILMTNIKHSGYYGPNNSVNHACDSLVFLIMLDLFPTDAS